MVKMTPSKEWYKKALKLEENLDVSAGPEFLPQRTIFDLSKMPNYNKTVINGVNSVTEGKIFWTDHNKVTCKIHGACLCVSPDRTIWRCATCNEGAYYPH